jgi:hypothetical protein
MIDDRVIAEFRRAHAAMIIRILNANEDLSERMDQEGITLEWDRAEDVLYVTLGDPRPSLTESVRNTIYLRVHPDTLKLHGVEFHHAAALASQSPKLAALLELAEQQAGAPLKIPRRFAQDLRELVSAR